MSQRTRPVYEKAIERIIDMPTKVNGRVGELAALSITPAAVDKLCAKLLEGPRGQRGLIEPVVRSSSPYLESLKWNPPNRPTIASRLTICSMLALGR